MDSPTKKLQKESKPLGRGPVRNLEQELRKRLLQLPLSTIKRLGESGYSSSGVLTPSSEILTPSSGTLTPATPEYEDGPLHVASKVRSSTLENQRSKDDCSVITQSSGEEEEETVEDVYTNDEETDGSSHSAKESCETITVASEYGVAVSCDTEQTIVLPTSGTHLTNKPLHKSVSDSDIFVTGQNSRPPDSIFQTRSSKRISKSLNNLDKSIFQTSITTLVYINSPEFLLPGFHIKSDEKCELVSRGESYSSSDDIMSSYLYSNICCEINVSLSNDLLVSPSLPLPLDYLRQGHETSITLRPLVKT